MKPIYLDYNATTPIHPEVAEAMLPFLKDHFGNPSSSHWYGMRTREAVGTARSQVAGLLGCKPEEVVFTSGGSESNNMAIKGVAHANRGRGHHIVTTSIEHPAVLEVCRDLERIGFQVTYVPVDEYGMVSVDRIEGALTQNTVLVSVMHANNEVGTIQPIAEISRVAQGCGIPVHTDAAQSVGKIPARVDELGVDLLSVAGHKVYAPKGIGALYVRSGTELAGLIHGAGQEQGRRAGTENVLEIVGLGRACEIAARGLDRHATRLRESRDLLHTMLSGAVPDIKLNGHPHKRLPNTLSISFRGIRAARLLEEVPEIAASPGAACHSDGVSASTVLEAMAVPIEYALGTVRFSTGRETSVEEIERAVGLISAAVERLRS